VTSRSALAAAGGRARRAPSTRLRPSSSPSPSPPSSPRATARGGLRAGVASLAAAALVAAGGATARAADVVVLDDGERVARDAGRALPPSPWPAPGPIDLFAMRQETIAFQVIVGPDAAPLDDVRATLAPFSPEGSGDAGALDARVEASAERFVPILRPSGNDREPGSLAFTAEAAPARGAFVGAFADPLVPGASARAGAGERAAIWVDVLVGPSARPGRYRSRLAVTQAGRTIGERDVALRVLDATLPYAGAKIMAYYDPLNLTRRIGSSKEIEASLRRVLHAHHVSAIHEVTAVEAMADLDDDALRGALFTRERGYDGPGQGVGEGVFAIGAYGALGDPDEAKADLVARFAAHLESLGVADRTDVFVYAVDEKCKSPRPQAWRDALAKPPYAEAARRVLVGATCNRDPKAQAASLVMMTSDAFTVAGAASAGKPVWVYNGVRPHAGPMMLDVPAVDLRANAWIAARYGVPRWFYWESTFWFDDNRGGKADARGFDPFEVAETFHNQDGDYDDGDGVLVYPGHQGGGMHDEGIAGVVPSLRLKNLRRGAEDAAYVALARERDRAAADAVVARVVPRALEEARGGVAWPERGADWLAARRELADLVEGAAPRAPARSEDRGCVGRTASRASSGDALAALAALTAVAIAAWTRRTRRRA